MINHFVVSRPPHSLMYSGIFHGVQALSLVHFFLEDPTGLWANERTVDFYPCKEQFDTLIKKIDKKSFELNENRNWQNQCTHYKLYFK